MSYPRIELRRDHWLVARAIYLVLNRLDIACDIEELIERIGHEAVAKNLNDAGSANSGVRKRQSLSGQFIAKQ